MSALIAVSLVTVPEPARASGHVAGPPFGAGAAAAAVVPLLILPSDIGTLVDGTGANVALGWALQLPVSHSLRHRIAGGLDWVPTSEDHHFRGRIAYRFGRRHFFTGLGPAFDHAGTTWSPELGVKFAHAESAEEQLDLCKHTAVTGQMPRHDRQPRRASGGACPDVAKGKLAYANLIPSPAAARLVAPGHRPFATVGRRFSFTE